MNAMKATCVKDITRSTHRHNITWGFVESVIVGVKLELNWQKKIEEQMNLLGKGQGLLMFSGGI